MAFGQILTTVDKSPLTVVSNEYRRRRVLLVACTVVSVDISRASSTSRTTSTRGMRASEALDEVRTLSTMPRWWESARCCRFSRQGTGVEAEEIRRYLADLFPRSPRRPMNMRTAAGGITIVTFDLS